MLSLWQIPAEIKRKKRQDSGNSADFSAFFSLSLSRSLSRSLSLSAPVHKAALLVRFRHRCVRRETREKGGDEKKDHDENSALLAFFSPAHSWPVSLADKESAAAGGGSWMIEQQREREREGEREWRRKAPAQRFLFLSVEQQKEKEKTCLLLTLSLSLSAESPSLGKNATTAALLRHCGGFGLSGRRNRRKTVGREEGNVSLGPSRVWLQVGSGDR